MNFSLWFIILALTVWRTTSLLVNEGGPFDIFAKLRYKIGVRYDERSVKYGTNVVANAFSCTWCLSFWLSIPVTALLLPYLVWWQYPFVVMAMNAAVIVIDQIT